MKKLKAPTLFILLSMMIISTASPAQTRETYTYTPKSQELYNIIVRMDSLYFTAYNTCDMATQTSLYADSIEFYHDGGGLQTSKKALLAAIKQNICGKVTRVLVKGSIEVYGIPGFGAIEIGLHRFINHQESETPSKPGRFVMFWRYRDGKWQITRVASMHGGN